MWQCPANACMRLHALLLSSASISCCNVQADTLWPCRSLEITTMLLLHTFALACAEDVGEARAPAGLGQGSQAHAHMYVRCGG